MCENYIFFYLFLPIFTGKVLERLKNIFWCKIVRILHSPLYFWEKKHSRKVKNSKFGQKRAFFWPKIRLVSKWTQPTNTRSGVLNLAWFNLDLGTAKTSNDSFSLTELLIPLAVGRLFISFIALKSDEFVLPGRWNIPRRGETFPSSTWRGFRRVFRRASVTRAGAQSTSQSWESLSRPRIPRPSKDWTEILYRRRKKKQGKVDKLIDFFSVLKPRPTKSRAADDADLGPGHNGAEEVVGALLHPLVRHARILNSIRVFDLSWLGSR